MGGNLTITQPTVTRNIDDTVPDVVRGITQAKIDTWDTAGARPNPETLAFSNKPAPTSSTGRKDQLVNYQTDLANKPTSRDTAGIQDVATVAELVKIVNIKPKIYTWIGDSKPERFL